MKIKCPNCNTNYNIQDSKIPEKGLLVKCSVCSNQFRVKKMEEFPLEEAIEKNNGTLDIETDRFESNSDESSIERNESVSQDLPDDEGDAEDTLNFKIKTTGEKIEIEKGADLKKEEEKVDLEEDVLSEQSLPEEESAKTEGEEVQSHFEEEKLDFSDDRFDGDDSLFEDEPPSSLKKESFMSLFEDDPGEKDSASTQDDDLFSDSPIKKPVRTEPDTPPKSPETEEPDDFLKGLFDDAASEKQNNESDGIYFRNKITGEIAGPFAEEEIEQLMSEGVVSEDDDISYDGMTWTTSESSMQPKTAQKDTASYGLSLDDDEGEAFDSISFDKGTGMSETGVFKDALDEFEDTSMHQNEEIDHIYIPDEFSEEKMEKTGHAPKKKKGRRGDSPVLFYAVLVFSTVIVIALLGGGFYYYMNYIRGNQGDVLDNISESIAVNTGTLVDVREALNKDLPDAYISSLGILKQYIKPDDAAPSAVGLDGQVKFNLLISYNKRVEPSAATTEKIDEALKTAPDNIDLIKAKALSLYESQKYDDALIILQPYAESSDPEIYYIFGMIAIAKKDMQKAEMFFNTGFIKGGGKNSKIVFALAEMKYRNGDAQSAMAFLNRIITESPNYLKAYLLKASIIMNTEGKLEDADQFLKQVDSSVISKAEDFQKADYYQKLATIAHKRGFMKEAVGYYEKAVAINKTDTSSITTIADFYVQISNSAKAMEYYDMALKIDAKFPPAILGKTEIFILLGQKDRVYLELAKLDINSIKDSPSLIRLGSIYFKIGDKGKSMEFYDLAIKSNPSIIEPYLAKMVILLEFKKMKEINEIAAAVEKLGKETYAFNLIKAVIFHEEADYTKAEAYFKKAVERNTSADERVFYFYGLFLMDKQKYSEAQSMLERAHKIDPRNYEYIQAYADSLEKGKKWKAVINLLESGTFNEKKMYRSYVSLSNSFYALKKYEEALNYINRALELNSQHTHIFYTKSKIFYAMERYDEAKKEIETAIVLDMRNFDNYMLYAKVLAKQGDFKGAIEKIEAAEKIDPNDQQLLLMKGIVYKNIDDYRSALQYFRKVTKASLKREAYLEIGESYLQLNRTKEAMDYFKKAEASGNKFAHKHLAMIYYETGKMDLAIKYFRKALRADKTDTVAMRQLGYMYKEKQDWIKALSYFKMYIKKVSDPYEKKMIQDEIYYLEKNLPQGKPVHIAESVSELDENDVEAINERAKELYIEGRALREEDPDLAREKFMEVMKIVPPENNHHKKASKALRKLNKNK